MRIFRPFLIGLFSFLCVLSVGLLVYIGTLQMTVLNRSAVKSWIQEGGVYQNKLFPTLIQPGNGNQTQQAATNQYGIPMDAVKLALERTFTKDFVQKQTETVIDHFYDWLEGKAPTFSFAIPINEKRDAFITEFARASTPYIEKLPPCGPPLTINTPCLPPKIAPDLYALNLVTSIVDQSKFFKQPITSDTIPKNSSPMFASLAVLEAVVPYLTIILVTLVFIAFAAGFGHIWLITPSRRLRALAHLGKRIFFSQVFTLIGALFLLWAFYSGFFRLPNVSIGQNTVISNTLNAVLKLAIADIAGTLAIFSGIVVTIGLATWISITIYRRKRTNVSIVDQNSEETTPSDNSDDNQAA